jgi:hypothetical protein
LTAEGGSEVGGDAEEEEDHDHHDHHDHLSQRRRRRRRRRRRGMGMIMRMTSSTDSVVSCLQSRRGCLRPSSATTTIAPTPRHQLQSITTVRAVLHDKLLVVVVVDDDDDDHDDKDHKK